MRAMRVHQAGGIETQPLTLDDLPEPLPGHNEILVRVHACGVCRTDLHIVEGEVSADLPMVPGHQVVGTVAAVGGDVSRWQEADRVGVPWLHRTCGQCDFCRHGRENLCDVARFTGRHVNGGFAEYLVAVADYAVPIPEHLPDEQVAPLMCAGIVGFRALRLALASVAGGAPDQQIHTLPANGLEGLRLGLYGFGAAAHLAIQIARYWGCEVLVATRGDRHQVLARDLGAAWVGHATSMPSAALDAAVIFAPAGELVPEALRALRRGATLVLAGIHMSTIPSFAYERLYHEKVVRSVANATRQDARDFMTLVGRVPVQTETEVFALADANEALQRMKQSKLRAAAVLVMR